MIFMNDLVKKCKENGITITKMGIYKAGENFGFIKNTKSGKEFDQQRFLEWINKVNEKAPEGFKNLKELKVELKTSYAKLYQIIKQENLEEKRIGVKGVIYVESERVKDAIQKRRHEYKW